MTTVGVLQGSGLGLSGGSPNTSAALAGSPRGVTAPGDARTSAAPERTQLRASLAREPSNMTSETAVRASPPASSMSAPAASRGPFAPLSGVPAGVQQVVTVTAPSSASTRASMRLWQRTPAGPWRPTLGPVPARLGSEGIGAPSESRSRTPAGAFTLTQAFGRRADPGAGLPYFQVTAMDWWVSDVSSPEYNTHQVCAPGTCPFNEGAGENLYRAGSVYDYALVIDYNRDHPRPGAGSAFFLHVSNGVPTAGCVSIRRTAMLELLHRLDPHKHPEIILGTG
jgi:L,D-peptidoglycan transpeptidase YkuD (ErfK/YbiS/YcfS/YnhG family)